MRNNKKEKWNEAYQQADISDAKPAQILEENAYLLPINGDALDLACGRAGNAIFLAKRGFHVDAIDNSSIVLDHLSRYVSEQNLNIKPILKDLEDDPSTGTFLAKKYDVIVVSYYLHRELFPEVINALKPSGLLFYQTWSQLKCTNVGPSSQKFCLQAGELLALSQPLKPIFFRENGLQGNCEEGLRNESQLIAQKQV